MHYGSIVGTKNGAERFAKGLAGKIEVVILQEEQLSSDVRKNEQ